MIRIAIPLASLALLSAACQTAPTEPQATPDPAPQAESAEVADHGVADDGANVVFSPSDLMTSVKGTPPAVIVRRSDLEPSLRRAIEQGVRLVSLPDRAPVRAEVVTHPPDEGANIAEWRFELEVARPLVDGWYAIELSVSAERALDVSGHALDASTRVARFHTGSFPIVKDVSVTPGEQGTVVIVELSERVSDPRPATEVVRLTADGQPVECRPGEGDGLKDPEGVHAIALVCPALDADAEVRAEFAPRLRSLSGRELLVPFGHERRALTFRQSAPKLSTAKLDIF